MMRSLWTAASGMTSQQLNVDTIANNLSNVNTTAYKKERMEFKSLLYETMAQASVGENAGRPVNLQVGHGVRTSVTGRDFTNGAFQQTNNVLDFALEGEGFFVVRRGDEEDVAYTRDGSFKTSVDEDNNFLLVTSDGYAVLDTEGEPIQFEEGTMITRVMVSEDGVFTYLDEEDELVELDIQFDIVQFPNREGLQALGSNLYGMTAASGEPVQESDGDVARATRISQRYLEMSNVQLAQEMVNLIIAQRAYETNSKSIQTSDDMLNTANNLKR